MLVPWSFGLLIGICGTAAYILQLFDEGFSSDTSSNSGFIVVWLIVWLVGGILVIAQVLWGSFGYEETIIGSKGISVKRQAHFWARLHRYDPEYISHLRCKQNQSLRGNLHSPLVDGSAGSIAFDYKNQTIYFAPDITDVDAQMIINRILKRFPQYREVSYRKSKPREYYFEK